MMLRNISLQQVAKSFAQSREGFLSMCGARAISTSENVNSKFVSKKDKISSIELDQRQKLKKSIRTLSILNHTVPLAVRATVSKDESRDFKAVFPDVVRDLSEVASKYGQKDVGKWFAKALEYTVPRGKLVRGLTTVQTYKELIDKSELTPENIRLAQIIGWCIEMLFGARKWIIRCSFEGLIVNGAKPEHQTMYIVIDDIIDGGVTRRGRPCWHLVDEVGLTALNDALMIEYGVFYILKKYFGNMPYYNDFVELFREGLFITYCGQSLDTLMPRKNVSEFNMDQYKAIVSNKSSHHSFYLPVAVPLHMCGYKDPAVFRQAKTILYEMGIFFQIQDDFLDCFGDPAVTGKVGTDIQENKCSWLAIVCMQRASEAQKKIMQECYGLKDPAKVARVKELYKELGLPNTYAIYEEEFYNMIKSHIQQISRGVPHDIFFRILDKIYQRDF